MFKARKRILMFLFVIVEFTGITGYAANLSGNVFAVSDDASATPCITEILPPRTNAFVKQSHRKNGGYYGHFRMGIA